jgi:hypothetical protein
MGAKKPKMAASIRSIQKVLMEGLNPISVRGTAADADEYNRDSMRLYRMLRENPSEKPLIDHMQGMLAQIGLFRLGHFRSRRQLHDIASRLQQIDVFSDEPME